MREFTPKELELAPKVAEVMGIVAALSWEYPALPTGPDRPMASEHDCLGFLCGRGNEVKLIFREGAWACRCLLPGGALHGLFGKTALEALYRCAIGVGK